MTLLMAAFCAFAVGFLTPTRASAASEGVLGWVTPLLSGGTEYFPTPGEACEKQHEEFGEPAPYLGFEAEGDYIFAKKCKWKVISDSGQPYFNLGPGLVFFHCALGYKRVPPGRCVAENLDFSFRGSGSCATSRAVTGRPIDLLTGAKMFSEDDFKTADGGLNLRRHFVSLSFGGAGDMMVAPPRGLEQFPSRMTRGDSPDAASLIHPGCR